MWSLKNSVSGLPPERLPQSIESRQDYRFRFDLDGCIDSHQEIYSKSTVNVTVQVMDEFLFVVSHEASQAAEQRHSTGLSVSRRVTETKSQAEWRRPIRRTRCVPNYEQPPEQLPSLLPPFLNGSNRTYRDLLPQQDQVHDHPP